MGLYLYCVTRPENAPGPTLAGVCGDAVRILELAGLAVWHEATDRTPDASLGAVRAHHGVVAAAAAGGPALPLRFGQWVPDAEALKAPLERDRARYQEALDRVEGAVELGVRIAEAGSGHGSVGGARPGGTGGAPERPASGRAYLEALRERERRRAERRRRGETLARELAADLGPLLRDERTGAPSVEGELVSAAHLVGRNDVERHGDVVRSFRERHPGLRIVRSGPWPPYSFTPGEPDDGGEGGRRS